MREEKREGNGAPKSNVLTSGSPMANLKSGPDYSVFINEIIYFPFCIPRKMYSWYQKLKIAGLDKYIFFCIRSLTKRFLLLKLPSCVDQCVSYSISELGHGLWK
jgi:hypothetical protein